MLSNILQLGRYGNLTKIIRIHSPCVKKNLIWIILLFCIYSCNLSRYCGGDRVGPPQCCFPLYNMNLTDIMKQSLQATSAIQLESAAAFTWCMYCLHRISNAPIQSRKGTEAVDALLALLLSCLLPHFSPESHVCSISLAPAPPQHPPQGYDSTFPEGKNLLSLCSSLH